jgi:hypothetical protein
MVAYIFQLLLAYLEAKGLIHHSFFILGACYSIGTGQRNFKGSVFLIVIVVFCYM